MTHTERHLLALIAAHPGEAVTRLSELAGLPPRDITRALVALQHHRRIRVENVLSTRHNPVAWRSWVRE